MKRAFNTGLKVYREKKGKEKKGETYFDKYLKLWKCFGTKVSHIQFNVILGKIFSRKERLEQKFLKDVSLQLKTRD